MEFEEVVKRSFEEKKYEEVISLYTDGIKYNSNNLEYYAGRASAYCQLKKFELALKDAEKSIECNEIAVEGYSVRAKIYMSMNEHDLALKDYQKVYELQPSDENSRKVETVEKIIHPGNLRFLNN